MNLEELLKEVKKVLSKARIEGAIELLLDSPEIPVTIKNRLISLSAQYSELRVSFIGNSEKSSLQKSKFVEKILETIKEIKLIKDDDNFKEIALEIRNDIAHNRISDAFSRLGDWLKSNNSGNDILNRYILL